MWSLVGSLMEDLGGFETSCCGGLFVTWPLVDALIVVGTVKRMILRRYFHVDFKHQFVEVDWICGLI
jgi:hypothetical protein